MTDIGERHGNHGQNQQAAGITEFEVRAIPADVVRQLRLRDDAGAPPRPVVCENGGSPLRCCLSRSEPGDELALVSYAPLRRWARETGADPGPYDELGPVFLHARDCGGWRGTADGGYPDAMRGERRVLRAYGAHGRILGGLLLDAAGPEGDVRGIERGLAELYADPRVAVVHVRAVEFGCFHAETRRRGRTG